MAESRWAKVGVIAGVVAAVAAVAVFVVPAPIWKDDGGHASGAVDGGGATSGGPGPTSSTARSAASKAPSSGGSERLRHLAALPIVQGAGLVQVVDGTDLIMPCGTNQSDDRFREIEYQLPGPYATFTTRVTVQGQADPETTVGVEVFVRKRIDRSDRVDKVATVVGHPGQVEPISAELASATAVLIRLSCGSSALRVRYEDPRVVG